MANTDTSSKVMGDPGTSSKVEGVPNLGNGVDYSSHFQRGIIFESAATAISWAKNVAVNIGFTLNISEHKSPRKKLLRCSRGERRRTRKRDPTKRTRRSTSMLCDCPFQIYVRTDETDNRWVIVATSGFRGTHNHPLYKVESLKKEKKRKNRELMNNA